MPTIKSHALSLLRDVSSSFRAVNRPFLSHSKPKSRATRPKVHTVVASSAAADIRESRSYGNTDSSR